MDELNFKNDNPGAVKHGNFINYYQFHPPEHRLQLLPFDVFDKIKPVVALDIGCNAGVSFYYFVLNFKLAFYYIFILGPYNCTIQRTGKARLFNSYFRHRYRSYFNQ